MFCVSKSSIPKVINKINTMSKNRLKAKSLDKKVDVHSKAKTQQFFPKPSIPFAQTLSKPYKFSIPKFAKILATTKNISDTGGVRIDTDPVKSFIQLTTVKNGHKIEMWFHQDFIDGKSTDKITIAADDIIMLGLVEDFILD